MGSDFVAEMRAVIDEATGVGPYVSRVVAAEIVEKLRESNPDLLSGWLDLQAEQLVWREINDRDRSFRAQARATASRRRFGDAVDAAEGGDSEPLRRLLDMPFVIASGERVPLAVMTGVDCGFVADGYQRSARRAQMHAALLRALERRVGTDRVEDHYTEEQLRALWQSFGGG